MSYNIPLNKATLSVASVLLGFLSEKDTASCLCVSKSIQAIIGRILDTHWCVLKTHREQVEGILDFPSLFSKIDAKYSEKKPFLSFRKLSQKFSRHDILFDQLPLTITAFQHAENQLLRWVNEARIAIWPKIAEQCGIDSSSSTLKEINDEFNRAENIAKFKEIESLDLSGLDLQILPPELEKFTNLENLNLSNNWLTDLSPVITKLTHLTQLDLSNNELRFLSNIDNLTQLEYLDLGKNKLIVLPEALRKLKRLKDLFLNDNRLCALPYSIGQLKQLVALDLSYNELQCFPDEFWNLEKLTYLDLFHNQVRFIPDGISKLVNLRKLILSKNQLSSIPETLGDLEYLTVLLLSNNDLKFLPGSIGKLERLTYLSLGTNKIQSLPSEFLNLEQLAFLNLFDNQLTSIGAIGNLRKLKKLNLADNKLSFIPETFENLTQLEILNIENNPWVSIPKPILDSPIAALSSNETLATYRHQLTHPFFSPLAKLMQAIMQGRSENEIESLFNVLSQNDQNLILEQVNGYKDQNDGGEQHDLPKDCERFYPGVGKAIIMKYHQLSQEGKNQLYPHYENLCLLADMMEQLS